MKNNIGIGIMTLLAILVIILTLNLFSSKEQINTLYDNLSETSKERNIFKKNIDSLRKNYKAAIQVYQAALSLSQNSKNMAEARLRLSKDKLAELEKIENILQQDADELYIMKVDLIKYHEKYTAINKDLQNIANKITEDEHNEKELLLKNQIQALKKEVKEKTKEEEQEKQIGQGLNQELFAQQEENKKLKEQLQENEKIIERLKEQIEKMGNEHTESKKALLEEVSNFERQNGLLKKNQANNILISPVFTVTKKKAKRRPVVEIILPFTAELSTKLFIKADESTKVTIKFYEEDSNTSFYKETRMLKANDKQLTLVLNNRQIKQGNTYDVRFFDSNTENITKDEHCRFRYNNDCTIDKFN